MPKQTLVWTALPNGYSKDRRELLISLLVSPRLEPEGSPQQLGTFPDFLDWPATVKQTRFEIHFGASSPVTIIGSTTTGPNKVDDQVSLADSDVWKALFKTDTLVKDYQWRDLSKHEVLSYDAAGMDARVSELYRQLAATAHENLPTATEILGIPAWNNLVTAIARLDDDDRYFDYGKGVRNPEAQFEEFRRGEFKGLPPLMRDLALFQLFHTPPSSPRIDRYAVPPDDPRAEARWLGYEQTTLPKPTEFKDRIDFHQIVSAMSQYPMLLRKLGLVIDFCIARDAFNHHPKAPLWAVVTLPQGSPSVNSPRTRTLLDGDRFQPVPRNNTKPGDYKTVDRLLALEPTRWKLLQSDVDGAGMKVSNFARSLARLKEVPLEKIDPVTKQERETGAPALRNAGLMLVHSERAAMLKNSIARQEGFNKAAQAFLDAEDIVRGWRIDIWDDKTTKWHSLCRRVARYEISDGESVIPVDEEEGCVRLAATTSADKKSNADLIWLHEALISWTGWSLCAPPPGKNIHHNPDDHTDPIGEPEAEVPPGLRLKTTFRAIDGSLPRLRYGRKYWLRARVTDLAGNSLPVSEDDFGSEKPSTNARAYLRYDPISPPSLALVKPPASTVEKPAEGESMERLAIRTFNNAPADNVIPSTQRTRRFAVPARTSVKDAEHHGVLDRNGKVDSAFFAVLASKDNSLDEEKILTTGVLAVDPPVETAYAVMEEGSDVPYLPDPLAVHVAARLFDHPGAPSSKIISIPFYPRPAKWPEASQFKIELYEKPGDMPQFVPGTRTLMIPLGKADRATLRLSVIPSGKMLEMLGIWNLLTAAQKAALEKMALTGQHWMLTPWRSIELVHAVQKPLITPEVTRVEPLRDQIATYARPTFEATCSIKSTSKLDVLAAWNEPGADNPAGGINRERTDHAFSIKITTDKTYAGAAEYQLVKPDVVRFGGYFDNRVGGKVHEFNDTRYRRIEYKIEATSAFREFMPANVLTVNVGGNPVATDKNIKVTGPVVRTWIPSSAPPPAPEVLYVVPTFGWVRSNIGPTRRSWRRGGGLRVYLNRPWNASGYGEMLAVVLPSASFTGDPSTQPEVQPLRNFVTQWGNDPVWKSPWVSGSSPKRSNFPLARTSADPSGKWLPPFAPAVEADQPSPFSVTSRVHPDLKPNAPASARVDVAPHDVFYDQERELWYADIELSWGASYFPFVRLALSRYQPVSTENAFLSSIVLADFMALAPDRWLNLTATSRPRSHRLTVFGHTFADSSSHREAANVRSSSVVEVWVERLDPARGEDFGWLREPNAVIQPGAKLSKRATVSAKNRAKAKELIKQRDFETVLRQGLLDPILITPVLWNGTVVLPDASRADTRYRVAIAEYEEYLADAPDPIPPTKDQPPPISGRRLVFIEYVEIV